VLYFGVRNCYSIGLLLGWIFFVLLTACAQGVKGPAGADAEQGIGGVGGKGIAAMQVIVAATNQISLSSPAEVVLQPTGSATPATLAALLKSLPAAQRVFLVVRGLQTAKQPGVVYKVYLEGEEAERQAAEYVGSLNFFNARGYNSSGSGSDAGRFVSFDVAERLRQLAMAGKVGQKPLRLRIVPAGEAEAEARPTLEQVELVVQ
jgi:hypothetical protein